MLYNPKVINNTMANSGASPATSSACTTTTSNAMGTGRNVPTAATINMLIKLTFQLDSVSNGRNVASATPKNPAKNINGTVLVKIYQKFLAKAFPVPTNASCHVSFFGLGSFVLTLCAL